MFRFILTEKFVVGSIIFLILFCIGAVIWYQYNTEAYRKELTESFELLTKSRIQLNKRRICL